MLTSKLVNLRAWNEGDVDQLQTLKNDIELQTQLMGVPKPNSKNKILNWLRMKDSDEGLVFFVICNHKSEALGYVQLSNIDRHNHHGYLGICIHKDYWGKGHARETLQLIEDYSATVLGLKKILLIVNSDNLRAINFYNKIGFRSVGILEGHQFINSHWVDVFLMEKLVSK